MFVFPDRSVRLADGAQGRVLDVIVDPAARRVTRLVVSLTGMHDGSRLIPIPAMTSDADPIRLSWSRDQVTAAPQVEDIEFLDVESWPHAGRGWDVGLVRSLAYPDDPRTWSDVTGTRGYGPMPGQHLGGRAVSATLFDRILEGTAELRRASTVVSGDDHNVGDLEALTLDDEHRIVALVVDHGLLWTHRDTALRIGDVASISTDRIQLRLSAAQVARHPWTRFHRHHGDHTDHADLRVGQLISTGSQESP